MNEKIEVRVFSAKRFCSTNDKTSPKLLVLCQLFYPELISTGQTLIGLCEELGDVGVDIEVVCGYPTISNRDFSIPGYMEQNLVALSVNCRQDFLKTYDDRNWQTAYGWLTAERTPSAKDLVDLSARRERHVT